MIRGVPNKALRPASLNGQTKGTFRNGLSGPFAKAGFSYVMLPRRACR
jgi:hypothetical protein